MMILAAAFSVGHAATIRGRIDDSKTGIPVVGAKVRLVERDQYIVADKLGRYELNGVPTGTHTLEFTSDAHSSLTVELKISHADESIICNVFLTPTSESQKSEEDHNAPNDPQEIIPGRPARGDHTVRAHGLFGNAGCRTPLLESPSQGNKNISFGCCSNTMNVETRSAAQYRITGLRRHSPQE